MRRVAPSSRDRTALGYILLVVPGYREATRRLQQVVEEGGCSGEPSADVTSRSSSLVAGISNKAPFLEFERSTAHGEIDCRQRCQVWQRAPYPAQALQMIRLNRFYFETSALNAFAAGRNIQDAIATKALQNSKGRGWYISPLVLWEVLLTSDELTRESLIHFAQHLFEPDLLPSPEELIVRFVESGCPAVEPEYPLISTGAFANAWRDICSIKEKTLIHDDGGLRQKTAMLRETARLYHEFTKFNAIDISSRPGIAGLQVTIQQVLDRHSVFPSEYRDDFETVRHLRLVTFFIMMILCAGLTTDQVTIDDFWRRQGARNLQERIDAVFSTHPQLVLRGPFHQIAFMAHAQSASKFSRGVYFDSLHTVYSIYADALFSADEHFRAFRENLREVFPHVAKIHHFDELQFTATPRDNPPPESFLLRP